MDQKCVQLYGDVSCDIDSWLMTLHEPVSDLNATFIAFQICDIESYVDEETFVKNEGGGMSYLWIVIVALCLLIVVVVVVGGIFYVMKRNAGRSQNYFVYKYNNDNLSASIEDS